MALLSYAHTSEMTFAPLQTTVHEGSLMADVEVGLRACSPRSVYSLATAVGTSYTHAVPSADVLEAWDR
jgi:hypothetical protein